MKECQAGFIIDIFNIIYKIAPKSVPLNSASCSCTCCSKYICIACFDCLAMKLIKLNEVEWHMEILSSMLNGMLSVGSMTSQKLFLSFITELNRVFSQIVCIKLYLKK